MKKTERKPRITASKKKVTPDALSRSSSAESNEFPSHTEIKELIELIAEKQFTEFELELPSFRLRLQKDTGRAVAEAAHQAVAAPAVVSEGGLVETVSDPPAAAAQPTPAPAPQEESLQIIASPIVGTFYRAASPTSEPFVKLGDPVEAGKTLCIIEAMKLMNEIQSDASGTVAKIFVENGQPVEYGQPLFGIKV